MLRSALLPVVLVALFLAPPAWAEKVRLTAAEIELVLAGNTISGTWAGTKYKQYFGVDGFTVYVPEGGSGDEGKWRVDAAQNTYESWWESTGWTDYAVVHEGDTYYWVDSEANEHPFVVLEGKRVSW